MDHDPHPVGHDAEAVEQPVGYLIVRYRGAEPFTVPVYAADDTDAEHDANDFAVARHIRRRTLDHAGAELAAAAAAVDADPIGTLHAIAESHRDPDLPVGEHGDVDALRSGYTDRGSPGRRGHARAAR